MPIARPSRARRAPISNSRRAPLPRLDPPSSPLAASPAPGNQCWRGCWRPMWNRCRGPSSCAPTSSARRFSALSEAEKLPSSAYTDEVNARVYATLGDKARRIVAAGHSVIVDAVFAKPEERAAIADAAKSARLAAAGPVPHGRHGHQAEPRRRPRPRCLRCRCGRGAGAGALRTGPPGLGQDRCLRDAGSHPGPRQGSPASSLID